ncbi:MAG: 4'-phosphopantetheinyl transferase superfamily protein [Saprospiraceae bacterium]|jgi:phosphopantetheinyl transferase|nr:4'-phosphopantetheinyl transferase superfamily protein [Saprospiraceae bacterium]
MPLFYHRQLTPAGELGIWKIEESEDFFASQLALSSKEKEQLATMKGARRVQWFAVRQLVHIMSGREKRGAFIKDEFGKPRLEYSPFDISISHSGEYAAAIAAPYSVGIDIQRIVGKIERIAHKFMRPIEADSLKDSTKIEHLHVYWGAKEALYKAYGRRALDFCQHILIDPFTYDLENNSFTGQVIKEDFSAFYQLEYERIDQQILVYARAMNAASDYP